MGALSTVNNQMVFRIGAFNSEGMLSDNPHSGFSEADVSPTLDLNGSNPNCYQGGMIIVKDVKAYDSQVYHGCKEYDDGISQTVNAQYSAGGNQKPLVVSVGNGQLNQISMSDKANSLDTMHDQQAVMTFEAFGVDSERQTTSTLKARNDGTSNCDLAISQNSVRRLTPLECERLQGYPDGWTDIPGATDSKRYKALGNSIALPFWEHLAHRFVKIGNVQSIGSLFDGIGGFPLVFRRAGAETKWTSEIEPFCEDVVRFHTERGEL